MLALPSFLFDESALTLNPLLRCVPVLALLGLAACSTVTVVEPAPPAQATPPAETAEALARRGHQLAEANRVDEAMAELSRALALDPRQQLALRDRAILLHAAGRQAEALADIKLAAELKPDDMRTVGALCVIRVAAERSDAGLADCDRALTLPGSKANAWTSKGQAQLLLGRHAEAVAAFNEALLVQANHMRALFGRGLARQAAGDTISGRIDMSLALKYLPGAGREYLGVKVS
ncbi:tetratricopeptide repeat protein [Piscinibacter gummiphilus]|nr:tetratricopeptide repeat protein [Piscinibacter gummiphilus]GLS94355.1 hypothetical protein GCM10007918_16470 [Piscinibacter gummiphilus]